MTVNIFMLTYHGYIAIEDIIINLVLFSPYNRCIFVILHALYNNNYHYNTLNIN